jgi:hypothetical protein
MMKLSRLGPLVDADGNLLLPLPQDVYDALRHEAEAFRADRSHEVTHDAAGRLLTAALFNIKVMT